MAKGDYLLLHNMKYVDYDGQEVVEIGKVVETATGKSVMYIVYDKDLYKKRGYHICIDEFEAEDNSSFPVASVDDFHRNCLFENRDIFFCMMLHELGHFKNGDLMAANMTDEIILKERERCIKEGRVQEQEKKADEFAVNYVGKGTFMRTMDYMIQKRKQRGDQGAALAIKEFELRKKAVQRLK